MFFDRDIMDRSFKPSVFCKDTERLLGAGVLRASVLRTAEQPRGAAVTVGGAFRSTLINAPWRGRSWIHARRKFSQRPAHHRATLTCQTHLHDIQSHRNAEMPMLLTEEQRRQAQALLLD